MRNYRLSRIAVVFAAVAFGAGAAGAVPLAPTPGAAAHDGAELIQVRGGCGFGEHRGPFGGCRINHGPRGRIRAATTGLPGGCPPGMHRGFYGRCRF